MPALGGKTSAGGGRTILFAAIGVAVVILILTAILAAGVVVYILITGHSTSTTTVATTTTTSVITTTKTTTTTQTIWMTTTTPPSTSLPEPTTSEAVTSTTEESTTTLLDQSELAACLNGKEVKLFVNDACLTQLYGGCKGIQKSFGTAFDQLYIVNCNLEDNEEECDNAHNDVDKFGFPLWYAGLTGEYYPGATVTRIRAITGC